MQKLLLSVVLVVLCAPMLLARRENNERDNRRMQKQALRKCEYQWGECVFTGGAMCGTGKKTGTSDNAECPVKQVEKKCKVKCTAAQSSSNCKYRTASGSEKSECDPLSKKRPITQTLVSGGDSCQKSITVYKPCRRSPRDLQNDSPANTDNRCKYRKGQKGECNAQTNMRTITMTLKRKSPTNCAPSKTIEKPCKVKPARQDKSNGRKQQGGRQTGGGNRRNREP